ncbi:HEAT repeat domain-containing protein [Bradyrhizobium sp. CCBAU 51753]|uniref:HEAT repeat domain-containing protein n=1 Tax=Bradyrhizobium sp. CCBAU 51753 TaxID=1325100 RepID=UPI001889F5E2|nr:HEAT repeat domain-containing protein [Bradyrhizobium sp. CCBAU 51753]QOZ25912.1 hypothetical protein XH93_21585 [Bradyrhizobium sp. CCBAU 51753]
MNTDIDTGGANSSYKGYAYQKLVTVWVALELMFGPNASASEIIVEPASHDDVKAKLIVPEEDADGELKIEAGHELHVQIKFKGAGYWSAQNFADVVNDRPKTGKRGPAPRARAKSLLLKDASRRYVLITNTSVDDVLAKGRIKNPGDQADPSFLPTNLNLDAKGAAALKGRFALIEQMTPDETRRQVDKLLTGFLNVPTQNLDACVGRVERLVEDRFLEVPDPLRRSDIERIAKSLGGLPHSDPRLAHYVAPGNRAEVDRQLQEKGAVLLIGPSGYGKSLTAESLADARRRADPPYKVVRETDGLSEIEDAFKSPGRVLFHLEDPWGQSGLKRDDAARWTSLLGNWLRDASPAKQFVITSRSEIYREALGEAPAPIWTDRAVVIDDSSYSPEARRAILQGNLEAAGSWRQDLAHQHEERLLHDLRSPFEIDGFARQVRALAKPTDAHLDALIERAQNNGRRHVVMDHVKGFGDGGVRGAAVLWALLRSSRPMKRDRLIELRRAVERVIPDYVALDDLADHLAQTQLQRDATDALLAHSKVAEALETLARTHPRAAEKALNAAALGACTLAADDASWIDELQRLFDGAQQLVDKNVVLRDEVVDTLDGFLIDGLRSSVENPRRFRVAWQAAELRLSTRSAIGKLVHGLARGAPRETDGFGSISWLAPQMTEEDRAAVLAADARFQTAHGFVAHILPHTHEDYDADELLPWLKSFGVDLTEAFLAGGAVVCELAEFVMSADAISEGALAWPDPPYDKVWEQIEKMDDAVKAALEQSAEERRQAWQGELDFAVQLAIQDRADAEGPSVAHYAKGYLRARRRQEGFEWIPGHPRPEMILSIWAEAMRYNEPETTEAELDAFFFSAGDDDWLQAIGLQVIGERRLEFARHRIEAALRSGGPNSVDAAVRALRWLEGDDFGQSGKASAESILLALIKDLPPARAARLAPFIVSHEFGPKKRALAGRVVVAAGAAKAAVQLALADSLKANDETLIKVFRQLPAGEADALIVDGPRPLARRLLMISAAEGLDVVSTATAWTAYDDKHDAQAAVRALSFLQCEGADDVIEKALKHEDYEVRRSAIEVLAPRAEGPRRLRLLNIANDRSAPVRAALAEVIGEHEWTDGLPTLLTLLGDTRNYARHPEQQRREEPEYHVARAAADALGKLEPLPAEIVERIIAVLDGRPTGPVDVEVDARLLGLLRRPDDLRIWATLERGLEDNHVVGESSENLYPIRYAAAWSIVYRLSTHRTQVQHAPWTALAKAAEHVDPQLAAPALLALGDKLAAEADGLALDTLRGEHATPARIALALAMIDDPAQARSLAEKHDLLPAGHPLFDSVDDTSAGSTARNHWPLSLRGRSWLEQLHGGNDVEDVLLWLMSKRTGLDLAPEDLDPEVLRRQKSIPLTTTAELFGME